MAKSAKSQVGVKSDLQQTCVALRARCLCSSMKFDVFGVTKNLQKQTAPPFSQMVGESFIDWDRSIVAKTA
jgi:hypothetical protein